MTPLQVAIRDEERIWGCELVEAMLRVAQACALGQLDVADLRIREVAGHPRGAAKRMTAVRLGADRLLALARAQAALTHPEPEENLP